MMEKREEIEALKREIQSLRGEIQSLRGEIQSLRGEIQSLRVLFNTRQVNVPTPLPSCPPYIGSPLRWVPDTGHTPWNAGDILCKGQS